MPIWTDIKGDKKLCLRNKKFSKKVFWLAIKKIPALYNQMSLYANCNQMSLYANYNQTSLSATYSSAVLPVNKPEEH
jgi:hypothetical protein